MRTVSKTGRIGIVLSLFGILTIFGLTYNEQNFWPGQNLTLPNNSQQSLISAKDHNNDQLVITLVAIWILLMIIGTYVLIHIHFKVLKMEER